MNSILLSRSVPNADKGGGGGEVNSVDVLYGWSLKINPKLDDGEGGVSADR